MMLWPNGKNPGGPFFMPKNGGVMNIKFNVFRDKNNLNDGIKGLRAVVLENPKSYYPQSIDLGYMMPGLKSIEPDPENDGCVIIRAFGEIIEHLN